MPTSTRITESIPAPVSKEEQVPAPISDIQHNMRMESGYAAFNGVFFGITFVGVHPLARTGVGVTPFELTILMSAFPVGASLGPFWAWLAGPRGMQKMVVRCGILSGLLLLPIEAITNSLLFTLLVATAQMLISPIRLGQSTLYGILYPLDQRGRIIGRFV